MLDVTQSLRVACSFAELDRENDYAYIYAFALPYPTGRISINSEHYLTNIRLLSVVPSIVKRPHNQEGFLLGEDEMTKTDKISDTFDFRRRAIAKFKIHLGGDSNFWGSGELKDRPMLRSELYPDEGAESVQLAEICANIKGTIEAQALSLSNETDETAGFLKLWGKIESYLLGYQREMRQDLRPTVSKSLLTMRNLNKETKDIINLINKIQDIRIQRNNLAHTGCSAINIELLIYSANSIIKKLEERIPGIKDMAEYFQKEKQKSKINEK